MMIVMITYESNIILTVMNNVVIPANKIVT